MPDRFEKRIMEHVADRRYQPQKLHQLARDLGIRREDLDVFRHAVQNLVEAGQVVHTDAIAIPPLGSKVVGSFRLNEKGFGFVVPDPDKRTGHGDLFVPAGNTLDAMTGDRVCAKVLPRRGGRSMAGRSPYIGRIVEIIQRSERQYVGRLFQKGGQWFVDVDGRLLKDPVRIGDPHARGAKAGDKVVFELIVYPSERKLAQGVITEVLGEHGEPDVETLAVIRAFGLKEKFEPAVLEEARRVAGTFDPDHPGPGRRDLTKLFTVTIDPPDAKDFDDAISLEQWDTPQADGAVYQLGVHIADVSFFVKPGGELDRHAWERGNSTYLPQRVVPMLPELLSNGVCSLQQGVARLTKSVFIRYDAQGKRVGFTHCNAMICSDRRLTYIEAQALIDGDLKQARRHCKSTSDPYPPQLSKTLRALNKLAQLILKRRRRQGMIELGLPEVQLIYDASGRVIDAQPEDDAFTHKLIEMFMVEANEVTAELFVNLDIPMIRRTHPDPSSYDIDELRQFARVAGYNIPNRPTRKELQGLLDSVRGKPAAQAVHFAVLKTLSKAEYAPTLIGHFALASEHYTHYTSPIRRYPDLVVHRALDAWFDACEKEKTRAAAQKQKPGGDQAAHDNKASNEANVKRVAKTMSEDPRCPDEEKLKALGAHCSTTERNSEAAERQLRTFLVLQLLESFLGDDFAGTVTGLTGSGMFVQLDKYLVDGFIRIEDLPGSGGSGSGGGGKGRGSERWRLNRLSGELVAQRSGRAIRIGDTFTVRIARVDPPSRLLDLVIISDQASEKPARHKSSPGSYKSGKGGKHSAKHPKGRAKYPRKKKRK